MTKSNWHMAIWALALTGIMALTVPVWAQQGQGNGPRGQGNQWCMGGGQGSGSGGAYCPNYQQGNANCPYYNSDNPRASRGRRGMRGGRGNQPATQTPPPDTSQQ